MTKKLTKLNQIKVFDIFLDGGLDNDSKAKPVRLARARSTRQANKIIEERLALWVRALGPSVKDRVRIKESTIAVTLPVQIQESKCHKEVK